MNNNTDKPYEFPSEMPQKDKKYDKGVIIDVVENEIKVNNEPKSSYNIWEYRGKNNTEN